MATDTITSAPTANCIASTPPPARCSWSSSLEGPFWASPLLAGQRLCLINTDGELFIVSAADGQSQTRVKLPAKG